MQAVPTRVEPGEVAMADDATARANAVGE